MVPMASFPELHDLIWLFEVEPTIEHDDLGWPASAATFETQRGPWSVVCTIEPYLYTVDLAISHAADDVVSLRMPEVVESVAVNRLRGAEALQVRFSSRAEFLRGIRLQLKPTVNITFEALPPWADR
jgi:hypothetical protein